MPLKDRPRLVAMMPGALGYRVEPSHGLPLAGLDVARQVRCLVSSACFAAIDEAERQVLVESIAQTIGRADYHFQRFCAQRRALDELRAWAPGDVFFDAAVSAMHYELQALAGAARLLVDELLFFIAKRHGCEQQNWAAARILREPIVPGSSTDRPEIHRLRSHRAWFDLLNTYRNAFFHSGWKHGSGHFDRDGRRAAELPTMNALLVPDRRSLRDPPYAWTYNDGSTVDDVGDGIYHGLIAAVGDLCRNEWGTDVPPAGTLSEEQKWNLMVALPIPFILRLGDAALVPIFSSREHADGFIRHVPGLCAKLDAAECELIEVHSNADVLPPTEVISLSFAQLDPERPPKTLRICLDPVPQNAECSHFNVAAAVDVPVEDLLRDKMRIVGIPVEAPMAAYIFQAPFLIR